ncbi:MAG: Acetyl-coenzyme A carboxyl transferase alpha chain, partial [uncultured Thermomicrobiales bacterium]
EFEPRRRDHRLPHPVPSDRADQRLGPGEAGPQPRPPAHPRLPGRAGPRLRRAPRRPVLRRRPGAGRRSRPGRRADGAGPGAPEGDQHQGEHRPELRDGPPGGLPEGRAAAAPRREVRAAGRDLHRHAGRRTGHRLRGARPGDGDRREPADDGGPRGADRRRGGRGGRVGWCPGDRGRGPDPDAGERRLRRGLPGGLRRDPLEGRDQGAGGRGDDADHRRRAGALRHRRRGDPRAGAGPRAAAGDDPRRRGRDHGPPRRPRRPLPARRPGDAGPAAGGPLRQVPPDRHLAGVGPPRAWAAGRARRHL